MVRKLLLLCLVFILSISMFAQVPDAFKYQAVIQNSSGEILQNQDVSIQISILDGSATGTNVFTESHSVTTSNSGLININIGKGTLESGNFSSINWASGDKYLKVEIDETGGTTYTDLGAVELLSIPYAFYANDVANKNDADADSTNEIQDLNLTSNVLTITNHPSPTEIDLAPYQGTNTDEQELTLVGDTLVISNGNEVILPYDSSNWVISGDQMYYNGGNVGIGSSAPVSNLEVKANIAGSDALFQVINANNDTVFAVYPDGVKIFIDPTAKGKVGGFAVSGRSPSKAGGVDILRVTIDSTRIYVSDTVSAKGKVGGFAVSGRSPSKGITNDYLVITGDSTRIYINDTSTVKGKVGGFAVSGRSPSKGTVNDYLRVTRDSTRVYVTESTTKGKVGGFAVSGRSPSKGVSRKFMDMTKENYFIGHESGAKTEPGSGVAGLFNTFFGYQAGKENVVGHSNVFIGNKSGLNNSGDVANENFGSRNVFLGYESGFSNNLGADNVFFGYQAGYSNTIAGNNVCIGSGAGYSNTQNSDNVFVGLNSGFYHGSGGPEAGNYKNNIYIGLEAGMGVDGSTFGRNNIYIGPYSGKNSTTGQLNVFMGYKSGELIQSGAENVIIGNEAGYAINGGQSNTIIGTYSGKNNDGSNNTFIGDNAGSEITSGYRNTFVGSQAGQLSTSGNYNVFMGFNAGRSHDSGNNNVYIGYQAGVGHHSNPEDGVNNVFIGTESGSVNTLGESNVFMGYQSGYSNTQGSNNVYIGNKSGNSNQLGSSNVMIGDGSGENSNILSDFNVFLGYQTGYQTKADNNTFIGYQTGYENVGGWSNTAVGKFSLFKNSSGTSNCAIGEQALYNNTSGGANVSVGAQALYSNSTGHNNTALGSLSFWLGSNYSNSTALGYQAVISANNQVRIGNNSVTSIGGYAAWSNLSDGRFKKEVNENVPGLEFILKLRPVTYYFDMDKIAEFLKTPDSMRLKDAEMAKASMLQTGFIAQEVEEIVNNMGYGFSGVDKPKNQNDYYSLRYAEFTVPLVKAVQEQQQIIEDQKSEISELKARLTKIEELLNKE